MNTPSSGNCSPRKITIKKARQQLTKSPLKHKRRKSSIPLQLKELITSNKINQIIPESSTKKSYKGGYSFKKNYINDIINTSIPEESENSSNHKDDKYKKIKKLKQIKQKQTKKNETTENNNYYIHYIKNVYENESHLNKENILKSAKKNINESFLKFLETNKNLGESAKRRNSALNSNFFKSKVHNLNFGLDKDLINNKTPGSIIDKKKNEEMGNLLHKRNLDDKQKKYINNYFHKSKHKNKDNKHKNKRNEKSPIKIEKKIKNNDICNKKKLKEKEILENEKKEDTENNTESTKSKKKNKLRKFLCCILNSNCDSSVDNN